MKPSGYETYCTYLALKQHFTKDNYDFFKYNGKVHVSKDTFLTRKDRFQFEKLARKCDDVRTHMMVNFLADRTWIGQMLDDDAFDNTKQYVKTLQSMSYTFKNEIEKYDNIKDLFKMESNGYRKFLNDYMRGDISFQTLIILDHFIGYIDKFDDEPRDDYLWSKFVFKARKYKPFLIQSIDTNKMKQALKEKVCSQ